MTSELETFKQAANEIPWDYSASNDYKDHSPALEESLRLALNFSDTQYAVPIMAYHMYQYPGTTSTSHATCMENSKDKLSNVNVEDICATMRSSLSATSASSIDWTQHKASIATIEWSICNCFTKQSWQNMWGTLFPLILSLIDDSHPPFKAKGCHLAQLFVVKTKELTPLMIGSGQYFDVLRQAIRPCLLYLPPGTDIATSLPLVRSAIVTLRTMALEEASLSSGTTTTTTKQAYSNRKEHLYELMYQGIFGPLSQCSGARFNSKEPDLVLMLLEQARLIIDESLKSETIHFLPTIIKLYMELMCDPFTSQAVIEQMCQLLMACMSYSWMRIAKYQFDIYVGLERARKEHPQANAILAEVQQMLGDIVPP